MSGVPRAAEALLRIWPDDLSTDAEGKPSSGTCIETSRVAAAVLNRFKVPCKVMAADVWMGNARAAELRLIPVEQWPADAWSVGVVSGTGRLAGVEARRAEPGRKRGFSGHVLVVGEDWLIDMTAPQFHRARHGIEVPGAIVLGGLANMMSKTPMEVVLEMPAGGMAIYRTRPELASFRSTNAWRDSTAFSKYVDIIAKGVQGVLDDEDALTAGLT